MSNIGEARRILKEAVSGSDSLGLIIAINQALPLLDRKKPAFVAKARVPKLTFRQKQTIRKLREQKMALNEIAMRVGTNIGRVSETLSEVADA